MGNSILLDLPTIIDWFKRCKDFKIANVVEKSVAEAGNILELDGKIKSALGFICFSYAMANGPGCFEQIEVIADRAGISVEFKEWAADWIRYSKKNK